MFVLPSVSCDRSSGYVCVLCAGRTEPHRTGAVLRQQSSRPLAASASADWRRQVHSSRPVRSVLPLLQHIFYFYLKKKIPPPLWRADK